MMREDRVVIRRRTAKDRGGRRTTLRRGCWVLLLAAGCCWLAAGYIHWAYRVMVKRYVTKPFIVMMVIGQATRLMEST